MKQVNLHVKWLLQGATDQRRYYRCHSFNEFTDTFNFQLYSNIMVKNLHGQELQGIVANEIQGIMDLAKLLISLKEKSIGPRHTVSTYRGHPYLL